MPSARKRTPWSTQVYTWQPGRTNAGGTRGERGAMAVRRVAAPSEKARLAAAGTLPRAGAFVARQRAQPRGSAAEPSPPVLPAREFFRVVATPEGTLEAQTAVLTLRSRTKGKPREIQLVATVHVGDPSYYRTIEGKCAASDACVFELIVDDALRRTNRDGTCRLAASVDPSPDQRAFAARHGLACQLACIEFRRSSWFLGDVAREEWVADGGNLKENLPFGTDDASATEPVLSSSLERITQQGWARRWGRWARVSPAEASQLPAPSRAVAPSDPSALVRNVAAVLLRGPMYSPSSAAARTEYASDARTIAARLGLSVLFPCPEAVLVGFDYATLGPRGVAPTDVSAGGLSAPALLGFVIERLVGLDVLSARRAVLAQVLDQRYRLSGCVEDVRDATIGMRNARAVEAVQAAQRERMSVMYGVNHCRELSFRLQRDVGLEPVDVEWVTAFTCAPASMWRGDLGAWIVRGLVLPSWLVVGVADWTDFVQNVAGAAGGGSEDGAMRVAAVLYMGAYAIRHAVLYAIVSSWALVW